MIAGVIPIAIAAIGAAYAGLVIRAAPNRRDNVVFGALAFCDALLTAWRGVNVLAGDSIVDVASQSVCSLGTIVLAVLTIEFIASFPRRASIGWKWRLALIAWALAGAVVVMAVDSRRGIGAVSAYVFFAPATLVIFALGARSWRLTADRDARTVIAMLWFRWAFGFSAYYFGPALGIFSWAVWAETTVGTLVSFVVIGTTVLRTDLFSLRSAAAELVTVATIVMIVLLGGIGGVLAVLRWTEPGTLQTALLIGSTLVPLHLAALARAMYPRLEANVLAPLDDRRARRLAVQDEPIAVDLAPDQLLATSIARIEAITDGSHVTWKLAPQLPPALVELLADGEAQRSDVRPDLPACFVVPALGGNRRLIGAFLLEGGTIDRDTYLVTRDLATRLALAVERAQVVDELESARQLAALGQFAAAIAHDIRTPLTSISLNVQILRRKLDLPDDDREHLEIALEELGRLDRSVAEILDFAKPVKLAAEPVDVRELLEAATRSMAPLLSEKGVALKCDPPSLLRIHGDAQRLRQVLVNLVDNAADASTPGTEVYLRATGDGARIAIAVEDHGRGIGAADLPRIFEPFFTTRPDGTGLGLAICHKVVRAHGGELTVRSAVGEGSTFTILLPAA